MAQMEYALIREQGVKFATVVVQDRVVQCSQTGNKTIADLQARFGCPVVLVGQRTARWFGRQDLVRFLSNVPVSALPWRKGVIH